MWKLLFFTYLLFSLKTAMASAPTHVVIDAGHGGRDSGASSNGLRESKLVLKISKQLYKVLKQDKRFQVTLTRASEKFHSLEQRVSTAHNVSADLFLSVHANSSPDAGAKGLEIFFQNQLPPDEESMFLANLENKHQSEDFDPRQVDPLPSNKRLDSLDSEVRNIVEDLQRNHRIIESSRVSKFIAKSWKGRRKSQRHTIRQAPFFVVSQIEIPSVLVEVGFVSNPSEAKSLQSQAYQDLIAKSLYNSLVEYKESLDK